VVLTVGAHKLAGVHLVRGPWVLLVQRDARGVPAQKCWGFSSGHWTHPTGSSCVHVGGCVEGSACECVCERVCWRATQEVHA
jgi:hypothetical protein